MAGDKFGWAEKMKKIEALKINIPRIVANTAQLHFNSEFNKASWNGQAWEDRKDKDNPKHLLVKSGALRSALNNSLKHADWSRVTFGIDLPYAEVHNYGFDGTVSAHERTSTISVRTSGSYGGLSARGRIKKRSGTLKLRGSSFKVESYTMHIPQRKFIGLSESLRIKLKDKILKQMTGIFK